VFTGALAMFDALGFKGIWKREGVDPDGVIDKLRRLQKDVNEKLQADFAGDLQGTLNSNEKILESVAFSFLSDTIVLGISTKPGFGEDIGPSYKHDYYLEEGPTIALLTATSFVANTLRQATATAPHLAYRGCIAYGQFALDDRFIVGPAVDEAAENMDRAQGAFVWLTPSASDVLSRGRVPAGLQGTALVPYSVPMKGGDTFATSVVSPLHLAGSREKAIDLTGRILGTFSGGLDVAIKRQNTERFLRAATERNWPTDEAAQS